MFIHQTRTNNKATGEGYFTYRLLCGERASGKVRQITVLNLGRNFAIIVQISLFEMPLPRWDLVALTVEA